mmetsp:Transcript_122731/g.191579  ORF Transcript_122731/g.191579 Transcript_122731/m.191579 type:complete len:217 (+) Transcript_122731:66-716(+)
MVGPVDLALLFGRAEVNNTFPNAGSSGDPRSDAIEKRSAPILATDTLAHPYLPNMCGVRNCDPRLGCASSTASTSFCTSVAEMTIPCETEWDLGEESSGIEWSHMEAIVRQVIEEPRRDSDDDLTPHLSSLPTQSLPQIHAFDALSSNQSQSSHARHSKNRPRRRRGNSLIDMAAKERWQQSTFNSAATASKACFACGGSCAPHFKFCQFCGMAFA